MYKRHEVFVVGGQPTVTYNPRPTQGLSGRLEDYLDERGRVLFITGPTKSGKTVLVNEMVPLAIRVSGGEISKVEDFWRDIVDGLAAYTHETAERAITEGTEERDSYRGGVRPGGVGVEGEHGTSTQSGTTRVHRQGRDRDPRRVAKQELAKTKPPVVVDDFHHIEPDVQRQIVRGVKDLVFRAVPMIFVAVPHRSSDIVRAEREMEGRIEQMLIEPWSQEELDAIAATGFDALNVSCEPALSERLARESYGSPHLMQDFCLQICKANEIKDTLADRVELATGPVDLDEWFRGLAQAEGTDENYRKLAQGPRQRTDRIQRRLRSGATTDIYGAVLHAIAWTGPKTELSWTEIRAALRQVLADEPPQRHEYTRVLEQMSEIARKMVWEEEHQRYSGDPVLDFDPDLGIVHVSDPFFAFQLRWAVRRLNGSAQQPLIPD